MVTYWRTYLPGRRVLLAPTNVVAEEKWAVALANENEERGASASIVVQARSNRVSEVQCHLTPLRGEHLLPPYRRMSELEMLRTLRGKAPERHGLHKTQADIGACGASVPATETNMYVGRWKELPRVPRAGSL